MFNTQDQGTIIQTLNRYLSLQNIPFRLNETGMCNGLVVVRAKYRLEGRGDDFNRLLKYISGDFSIKHNDVEVNAFVFELMKGFFPEQFDNRLNQDNAIESFDIAGNYLKSVFNFGLIGSDDNWSEIFKTIDLKENEEMLLGSVNHRVSVSKKDGKYVVYDPNYLFGDKYFDTTASLIKELHNNCFGYDKNAELAMSISIISYPVNQSRTFPNASELYNKYVNKDIINNKFKAHGKITTLLTLATENNDGLAVETLLNMGAKDTAYNALGISLSQNYHNVIAPLMKKNSLTAEEIQCFLYVALGSGKEEALNEFIKNDAVEKKYISLLKSNDAYTLLGSAVEGGNKNLINKIIVDCEKHGINIVTIVTNAYKKNQIISKAIGNGDYDGFKRTLELLINSKIIPNKDSLAVYLSEAIMANKPQIVELLLKNFGDIEVNALKISTSLIHKTDLNILLALEKHGYNFTSTDKNIISLKIQTKPIGIMLKIGIILEEFMRFFNKNKAIEIDINENDAPSMKM